MILSIKTKISLRNNKITKSRSILEIIKIDLLFVKKIYFFTTTNSSIAKLFVFVPL